MGKHRTKSQRIRDRKVMADLYLRGKTMAEIGESMNVSHATVSRDLKLLHAQWLRDAKESTDKLRSKELAKIDKLEEEYWLAWHRSIEMQEVEFQKQIESFAGKTEKEKANIIKREQSKRKSYPIGDPRFMQGIQWCVSKRCELLGLNPPIRTDVTSGDKPLRGIEDWKKVAEKNAQEFAELENE